MKKMLMKLFTGCWQHESEQEDNKRMNINKKMNSSEKLKKKRTLIKKRIIKS